MALVASLGAIGCSPRQGSQHDPGLVDHDGFFVVSGSHQGFDCYQCHDEQAATFSAAGGGVSCLGCHPEAEPLVVQAHAGVAGYAWDTVACIGCHKAGSGAFDHSGLFPIAAGATHGAVPCASCHGPTRAVADLQCTGCHDGSPAHADQAATDAAHGNLPGYAYASPACYACHQDGGIPDFDHAAVSTFPIAPGTTHAGIGCASCHGATRAAADLTCTSCHDGTPAHSDPIATAEAHQGVAGYAYQSSACFSCHQDGSVPLPADHDASFFPVTGTVHASAGCRRGHGATKQLADVVCTSCHAQAATATEHTAIPARSQDGTASYQWLSASCLRCHADGQVDRIASHPPVSHGIDGDGHAPFCLTCHPSLRTDKPWGADFGTYRCLACHSSNNPQGD